MEQLDNRDYYVLLQALTNKKLSKDEKSALDLVKLKLLYKLDYNEKRSFKRDI